MDHSCLIKKKKKKGKKREFRLAFCHIQSELLVLHQVYVWRAVSQSPAIFLTGCHYEADVHVSVLNDSTHIRLFDHLFRVSVEGQKSLRCQYILTRVPQTEESLPGLEGLRERLSV